MYKISRDLQMCTSPPPPQDQKKRKPINKTKQKPCDKIVKSLQIVHKKNQITYHCEYLTVELASDFCDAVSASCDLIRSTISSMVGRNACNPAPGGVPGISCVINTRKT